MCLTVCRYRVLESPDFVGDWLCDIELLGLLTGDQCPGNWFGDGYFHCPVCL